VANEDKLRHFLQEATDRLVQTRQRLGEVERRAAEPLAIVAMACRLPGGVVSPDDLWRLVGNGTDAITPFPTDRGWPGVDCGVGEGGFLGDAGDFDPEFFGVSPREALAMDPQQRLMLELSWEVFERAGIDPSSLEGSRTEVLIGATANGYGVGAGGAATGGHAVTGASTALISGRISYTLGLAGKAVTVDTACSSSLVALHLATRSLRAGECDMALVGGVTVMASPEPFVEFSRMGGLAPDGRCKAFAESADGTGWSEGAGLLLLERLSDAQRLGHSVLAVVRGTATNQDGRSNGLSAPNGLAQRAVIRQALADARLGVTDIDAVEAHGTGTTLGDPIEAQALVATYGIGRGELPLHVGSLKSNVGHTQSAAGVAGVIKMVLAMQRGLLPRTLHAAQPTSHVDWVNGGIRLLSEARAWPGTGRPRRSAVSSFGISGTNAHVVLEQAPPAEHTGAGVPDPDQLMWSLSGKNATALRAQAAALRTGLAEHSEWDPTSVARALLTTRAAFDHRAVVLGGDRTDLLAGLDAVARGIDTPGVVTGVARRGRTAVLFTGQGAQSTGMGRELYERFPVFAEAFDEFCERFGGVLPGPLKKIVFAESLDRTDVAQPALFAYEVALFRLWESFGLTPDFLLGHSLGEITAAHLAGVLSASDAVSLVAARGALMQELPEGGAMTSVRAAEHDVRTALSGLDQPVDIAAVNSPSSLVISGPRTAVAEAEAVFAERGWQTSGLRVSHAFHSGLMEPMLGPFARVVSGLAFGVPRIPLVSAASGRVVTAAELGEPGYWLDNVRRTVRFADSVRTLEGAGVTTYLEVGPAAVLTTVAQESVADGQRGTFIASQHRRSGQHDAFTTALAELFVNGGPVDRRALTPDAADAVDLPTYAFQRQRYWLNSVLDHGSTDAATGDDWYLGIQWRPLPRPASTTAISGTWLLVVPPGCIGADVANVLTGRGADVLTIPVDDADLAGRIAALPKTIVGIISLLSRAEGTAPAEPSVPSGLAGTLALARALADSGCTAPFWTVTAGAASVAGEAPVGVAGPAIAAMTRVLGLEQGERWGGLVDLPGAPADQDLAALADVLGLVPGEDQVAIRNGVAYVRRLVRVASGTRESWQPTGTVLVTGATGGVGSHVARWLAGEGARDLVLISRRGLDAPAATALRDELTALGAQVTVVAQDVADRDGMATLFADLRAAGRPVRAVVHAAGAGQMATPIARMEVHDLADVMAAKVTGAMVLDELTAAEELDAFVLFSSVAGVWGSGGQAGYCAANAVLDAIAQRRHAHGLPATAISWGVWADAGMVARTGDAHYRRNGLRPMSPAVALRAFGVAAAAGEPCVAIADIDWSRFAEGYTAARPRPLIEDLVSEQPTGTDGSSDFLAGLRRLSVSDRRTALLDLVRADIAAELGHLSPQEVDPDRRFRDFGFDSLASVGLRNRLSRATDRKLSAGLIYDYETPAALADHLYTSLLTEAAPEEDSGGLLTLYRKLALQGRMDAVELLCSGAAALRETFDDPAAVVAPFVHMARGGEGPHLVAFPPFAPVEGVIQFARLSDQLRGRADMSVVSAPGFRPDEPLATSIETLIGALASGALAAAGDRPFALLGYSSSGWLAHAVTARLEAMGVRSAALVLLDSYLPDSMPARLRRAMNYEVMVRRESFAAADFTAITAIGWYRRMFRGWQPDKVQAPTLFLRPQRCVPGSPEEPTTGLDWRSVWPCPHSAREVPGDHCTMVGEHSGDTAEAMWAWLSEINGNERDQ
jgi:acyl transferase domain-containing protein/acyl carrier protein